jgi:hypothetical protein
MTGMIAENVTHFARALRVAGVRVGAGAVLDAVRALEAGGLGQRDDVYWTLHATLITRHEDTALFDQAFALFWRKRALIEKMMAMLSPQALGPQKADKAPEAGALRVQEAFQPPREREDEVVRELVEFSGRLTLSDSERLKTRDFAQMTAAELSEVRRRIATLRLPDDERPTRRLVAARDGARIDLRRTLRDSLRTGGVPVTLAMRGPALKRPPIVALVDISGSMAEYSRILLHFLHALTEQRRHVHSFLFGTRLTNVSRLLRARDPDEALALCGQAAPDWEGGTRIGAALHAFNRQWGRRVLGGGATVLLFTDGLERQSLDELSFEMDRLKRSCRRLIWLNPLLRFDGFEARAGGVRAMLPHVHAFRPIHNLASMGELVAALGAGPDQGRGAHAAVRWLTAAA